MSDSIIEGSNIPIRQFKQMVSREVRDLVRDQPKGFTFGDLAKRLPPGIGDERQLRRQIKALCDRDVLRGTERGIFIAGDAFEGVPQAVSDAVWEAFWYGGGILTMDELRAAVADAGFGRGAVSDELAKSDRYVRGVPLDGYRNHWRVRDDLRRDIPMPGHWQLLELRMMKLRSGSLPASWGIEPLYAFQGRISAAVRNARVIFDFEMSQLAKRTGLVEAFDSCLRRADGIRPMDPAMADRFGSFRRWWTQAVAEEGKPQAFMMAWDGLEGDDESLKGIQIALDVRCWEEIGLALGADSGALSRGAIQSRGHLHF